MEYLVCVLACFISFCFRAAALDASNGLSALMALVRFQSDSFSFLVVYTVLLDSVKL